MDSSEKQTDEDNLQGDPTGKQEPSGETESENVQPPPENNTTSPSAGAQEAHTQAEDPSQDKAQAHAASEQVQQQPGGSSDAVEEEEERTGMKKLPEDMYYNYDELYSRPVITADSEIPENLLHLTHSFGYDCGRRANLQLLDERTLAFVAGNLLIFLDVRTKEQRYLRSCSGGGIGAVMAHPSNRYFAVAEKGDQPNIVIYEYPSLRPYRILRGGTGQAYSFVDFNREGTLLASVGSAPDYMLTLWEWRHEQVMLRCKAFSQDVYRVTFSPDNPGQLTTSGSGHIKFWKMASTFTGLKLQGLLGRFGKTALTDIEGYVELPDGKVVSGSEWGNMLLWDGGLIKVEICRKGGRTCHAGTIQQFALDEGELMTIGTDGAIRGWDFESIDTADCNDDRGLFEIEPMNEMVIGRNVSLSSMVKSCLPDSFIWFAQDSNGGIWKLDLSFSNITQDPECLFSFHAGVIQGMDVSSTSHLMATTALDRSVRIFDFLAKKELTTSRYKQGGTTLTWAPRLVNPSGGLVVVGFEDGVVRLLELYNPQSLRVVAGRSRYGHAELRLKQAFKPHNAPVTAIAYERNGEILATGSMDCTVFFFTVGDRYDPIGFVTVPGPVQGLEWSPQSHDNNTLLVLCKSGHVVEVQSPDPEAQNHGTTYHISGLPTRHFTFSSIKSHIKREEEIARRQALKEKRQKEREAQLKKAKEEGLEPTEEELQEVEEEEKEELPPLYTPDPPSPLCCGFYSQPGAFWLSMGGYDSGFLYHCKFSEQQGEDPLQRQDEPFTFLPVQNTDEDPIRTITFSSSRQLLLCGMQSGSVRAYPLQPSDFHLTSMQAFWALSVHDNQYGQLRQLRCSFDDQFVLTTGEDGNIFSFSLLPQEDLQKALQRSKAKVPSPRVGVEMEGVAQDIEDPSAYSIETAKQKLEMDRMRREAEMRKVERRKKLAELQSQFKQLLEKNQGLPEHVRLHRTELELDRRFREETERMTAQRVREARKELAWEEERHRIGLKKLQERFWDSLESDTVTVVAFQSDHRISTYRLLALSQRFHELKQRERVWGPGAGGQERWRNKAEVGKDSSNITADQEDLGGEAVMAPHVVRPGGSKLAGRQAEKLRKATEKAERARAKIEKRRKEWAELYAAKPNENCEDPEDVRAIRLATEKMGDFKLKTAKDFTVPEHLRMNAEKKRAQLVHLEEKIHERKTQMNSRIMALRDTKVRLVSRLRSQAQQLQAVQECLAPHFCSPAPTLPSLLPEETPERKLRYTRTTLQRYGALRAQRACTHGQEPEGGQTLLEQLEAEIEGEEETPYHTPADRREREVEEAGVTELEEEMREVEEIRLLYEEDSLLEQMSSSVWQFDAELCLLRHEKLWLDIQMKLADLRHVTLFQELLLLKEFEKRENSLQERLNACVEEEEDLRSKLEECKQALELKRRDISKLQERERAIAATFQGSLGENNKFADFLTRVFKKKIKRVKKKEKVGNDEEQEDSDEESDEESDWDDDEDDSGSESGGPLDDSVCPPNCDSELFENTVQLRERRLDLEELLVEEKKIADNLRKECDSLVKKEKVVHGSLKAAEGDLELFNREKQQKLNELDVVVPLRLHQIEFMSNGVVPCSLAPALVLNTVALGGLQERIKELQVEKSEQRDLYRQARQQHVQLIHDRNDMEAKIQSLEARCEQLMLMKFGKVVDLEALQTLSGNRNLEEMRQESRVREAAYTQELRQWEVKVTEARHAVTEVTRHHTERLLSMNSLLSQKKEMEDKLNTRQSKMVLVPSSRAVGMLRRTRGGGCTSWSRVKPRRPTPSARRSTSCPERGVTSCPPARPCCPPCPPPQPAPPIPTQRGSDTSNWEGGIHPPAARGWNRA
ncbi:cilia- and flagella-associated protein 44 isoform X1 [Coregonus clupeaformis]|uniref:cilia- and flagella-associated protein 44 isoform X1 n=1 Tax=Coregonus clupeaformis TaxID=59861 RepID=UPI001BE0CF57|nr:cilia- and flagella-associated protein 44 isoform X1 [Coregonus clupeaformis]